MRVRGVLRTQANIFFSEKSTIVDVRLGSTYASEDRIFLENDKGKGILKTTLRSLFLSS